MSPAHPFVVYRSTRLQKDNKNCRNSPHDCNDLLRSAAFRGQHDRVCILPFSAIGFTDINPASIGVGGKKSMRHSPTVINSAYSSLQFWDGGATSLEEQAKGPIENPVEMATAHAVVVKRLPADPKDVASVKPAWGTEDILALLDSWTAPLPDNLGPPAGLTTKQTAQNG
jgi:cytochrome c peroxidase